MAETAIPVSKNPNPLLGANHCTSSAVKSAAVTADTTFIRVPKPDAPLAMIAIVPKVAPLERPINVGSARGFRKIP